MKKFLCGFLALPLLLPSLSACGENVPVQTTEPVVTTDAPVTEPVYTVTDAEGNTVSIPQAAYTVLSADVYRDKTTAGFLAQICGTMSGFEFVKQNGRCRVGMPDEWFKMCQGPYAQYNSVCPHTDKLLKSEDGSIWEIWNDDDYSIDILNQYILADMYSKYNAVCSKCITEGWLKYDVYDMGGGQRQVGAYGLFSRKGYLPQFAGNTEYDNWYSYCTEAYLGTDTLGMDAAGLPEVASAIAKTFAQTTGDRDNVGWAQMFATMMSLAYFESDIPTIIRTAEKVFPDGAWQHTVIDEVFALKEKYKNWRAAFAYFENKHYIADQTRETDSTVNAGFVLLDLLYGGGDYTETCRIGSLAGYDCESTAGIALSIVAIIGGMEQNPEPVNSYLWQDGKGVIVNLTKTSVDKGSWMCALGLAERISIVKIIDKYQQNYESILRENGGYISDGNYYIPKSELLSYDSVVVENGGFETKDFTGFVTEGDCKITSNCTTGRSAATLTGNSEIRTTLKGLKVGESYRVTAFACTSTLTNAFLYVRETTATEGGVAVSVAATKGTEKYEAQSTVKRELTFTATAEEMTLGFRVETTRSDGFGRIDEITVVRVTEREIAEITVGALDSYKRAPLTFTVPGGEGGHELMLRLTFTNVSSAVQDVAVSVDGRSYGVIGISKTPASSSGFTVTQTVTFPVYLKDGERTVKLTLGSVKLLRAELLEITDRY